MVGDTGLEPVTPCMSSKSPKIIKIMGAMTYKISKKKVALNVAPFRRKTCTTRGKSWTQSWRFPMRNAGPSWTPCGAGIWKGRSNEAESEGYTDCLPQFMGYLCRHLRTGTFSGEPGGSPRGSSRC